MCSSVHDLDPGPVLPVLLQGIENGEGPENGEDRNETEHSDAQPEPAAAETSDMPLSAPTGSAGSPEHSHQTLPADNLADADAHGAAMRSDAGSETGSARPDSQQSRTSSQGKWELRS